MSVTEEINKSKKGGRSENKDSEAASEAGKAVVGEGKNLMKTEDQQQADQSAFLPMVTLDDGPENKAVPKKTPQTKSSGVA